MSISYTKTNWQDLPVKTTPLSAANLNKIENGIADSVNGVNANSHSIAELQTRVGQIANGSPTPVATVAEMTDESAVYLYTGSETGYTAGNWYYYDGTAWTPGGEYGGVNFDDTVCKYIEIKGCVFHDDTISPAIGNHSDMAHEFVRIHDCIFDGLTGGRGAINFTSSIENVDIHDNAFNGCTKGIGTGSAQYYVHDNRFVDVTTAINSNAIAHNNMINGSYVE